MDWLRAGERQITDEQAVTIRALAESVARKGCRFLEVGSWCGDSTVELGHVARRAGGRLYCVDWWRGSGGTDLEQIAADGDVFQTFWKRMCREKLQDVVIPIRARSDDAAEVLAAGTFDLVFLDADHRYQGIRRDIQQYRSLARPDGGVICGHDCEGRADAFPPDFLQSGKDLDQLEQVHCGVVLAVSEAFESCSIQYGLWSVRREDERFVPHAVELPGLASEPACPQSLGYTRSYELVRTGPWVVATPRAPRAPSPLAGRSRPRAHTVRELTERLGEEIIVGLVPKLLASHRGYNLVSYRGKVHAIDQAAGSLDLPNTDEQALAGYVADGRCIIADSVAEARDQVDTVICRRLGDRILELAPAVGTRPPLAGAETSEPQSPRDLLTRDLKRMGLRQFEILEQVLAVGLDAARRSDSQTRQLAAIQQATSLEPPASSDPAQSE